MTSHILSLATWVQFLMSAETLCRAPAISRRTEPVRVSSLTRALLYCCALYNFSLLDFVCDNLALTELQILAQPSYLHCFGELELRPGPALAHMCWTGTWAEIRAIV